MSLINEIIFLIFILPGVALAYAGLSIHRRHRQLIGFVLSAIAGAFLAVSTGIDGIPLLLVMVLAGIVGIKLVLIVEKGIVAIGSFLVTSFLTALVLDVAMLHPIPLITGVIGAGLAWRAYIEMIIVYTTGIGTIWMYFVTVVAAGPNLFWWQAATRRLWLPVLWVFLTAYLTQRYLAEEGYLPGSDKYISGGTPRRDQLYGALRSEIRSFTSGMKGDWKASLSRLPSERPGTSLLLGGAVLGFLITGSLVGSFLVGSLILVMGGVVYKFVEDTPSTRRNQYVAVLVPDEEASGVFAGFVAVIISNFYIMYNTPMLAVNDLILSLGMMVAAFLYVWALTFFVIEYFVRRAELY